MTEYEKLLEAADTVGDSLEAMQLSRRLAAALREVMAERDEAQAKVRWFVEHAADEKLDGYRELGARAAKAENERDTALADVEAMRAVCDAARDAAAAFTGTGPQMVLATPGRELERRIDVLRADLSALDARGKGRTA